MFDFKKEFKEFYSAKKVPTIITVPKMNYVAVEGVGNPNEEGGKYQQAINILYSISYALKMSYKQIIKLKIFLNMLFRHWKVFGGKKILKLLTLITKKNLIGLQQ